MKKISRIDVFMNTKSQHGVLANFTERLQRALCEQGIESATYDVFQQSLDEITARLVKNSPDCTIGFNVVLPEAAFYETLGIPHVAMIVDSASYYPELLQCPNTIVSFAEMDSLELMQRLGGDKLFFFPHACEYSEIKREQSPKYEILMPASFIDPKGPFTILEEHFPKEVVAIFDAVIEKTLASHETSHIAHVVRLMDEDDNVRQAVTHSGISVFDLLCLLELIIRGRDRVQLIQAIQKFHVTLACSAADRLLWEAVLDGKKNISFIEPIPYSSLPSAMADSKMVINSTPTIKRGFHERLFLALVSGASVLSTASVSQKNFCSDGAAVVSYLSGDYPHIDKKIEQVFQNPYDQIQQVTLAQERIIQEHTWQSRAQQLLLTLETLIPSVKK